jgi:hypothetical protein
MGSMFWRVVASLGALTFLIGGVDVASQSNCGSVDFGGSARSSTYTCLRDPDEGDLSQGAASALMIGGSLVALGVMWIPVTRRFQAENYEPFDGLHLSFDSQPDVETRARLTEIDPEVTEFLKRLPSPIGNRAGWYQDPARLFFARYFDGQNWTTSTSDAADDATASPIDPETSEVVAEFPEDSPVSSLDRLERLVDYLDRGLISRQEFDRLKSQIH